MSQAYNGYLITFDKEQGYHEIWHIHSRETVGRAESIADAKRQIRAFSKEGAHRED